MKRWLGSAKAAILTAGALATAIGAVLALWPRTENRPLHSSLSNVSIAPGTTLDEYQRRHRHSPSAQAGESAGQVQLAAYSSAAAALITAEAQGNPDTDAQPIPPPTDSGQEAPPPTSTTEQTPPVPTDTGTQAPPGAERQSGLASTLIDGVNSERLRPFALPRICTSTPTSESCGLQEMLSWAVENKAETVAARRLATALRGTRVRVIPSPTSPTGKRLSLEGVDVSFVVNLSGSSGRPATVRYSVYSADTRRLLPSDWLVERPIQRVTADQAGGETWVPEPKARGRYYIRLTLYDAQERPQTYVRTRVFR